MKHDIDLIAQRPDDKRKRRRRWRSILRFVGFVLFVVVPTAGAIFYYDFLASPIYVSTASFVVKDSSQNSNLGGIGQFLQSAGLATSSNDAYAITSYIQSRDALQELEKSVDIRKLYARPEADVIARFPSAYTNFSQSFEWLYWHYGWWTEADFNTTTNVTTLYAWAFRPDDAKAIATSLLELSERAANAMNKRARGDAVRSAKQEVDTLQKRVSEIQDQITAFRGAKSILNPNQTSTEATQLLMTLQGTLVSTRALLTQLKTTAPASPQIPQVKERLRALEAQVADQEKRNSGGMDTLAPKMSQYEALLLQQQFIRAMLQAAVTGLEAAEVAAIQQSLYVQRIAEPNAPDMQVILNRIFKPLIVFFSALLLYAIARLTLATVREHLS